MPKGPLSDENSVDSDEVVGSSGSLAALNLFGVNQGSLGYVGASLVRLESMLDDAVELLVCPLPLIPSCIPLGFLSRYRQEMDKLHEEVHFCLWAMHVSLSVYMKLINVVDISVRQRISDVVGQFLAEWKGGKGHALSDALDALIISLFREHSLVDIPDMARLQRNKNSIKDCAPIRSTVAAYIKDLAMKLSGGSTGSADTIEILFPSSDKFIGRCFFPRLAAVSYKLLDIIRSSEGFGDADYYYLDSPALE